MDRVGPWRQLRATGALGRFVLLCLGVWLHAADGLVTATIVPQIVGEIGGVAYVAWTVSLYQVGAIVAGAAAAMLCQHFGTRHVLVGAAAVYGAGCAMGALAPDMAVLLAARLVQGVGGGVLLSLSYIAIQENFAEHLWSRLHGIIAVIWAAGSLVGPLLGGLFVTFASWRWAFWFFAAQAAILGAAVALRPAGASARRAAAPRGAGPWPALLALSAATLVIAEAGALARALVSACTCALGLALLYCAAWLDRRSASRLLPARALDVRRPAGAGLLMVFALAIGTAGFATYGPLILKILFGTNPLVGGYILAGEAVAWSLATVIVSGAPQGAGRMLIRAGSVLVVAGAAGFAVAVPRGSLFAMVLCGLLQGFGFGLCWPSIVQRIVRFSDAAERAHAAAAVPTVQRIGYAVGAAATGIAANLSGLADGMSVAAARVAGFWVFAGFVPVLALGLAGAWRFTRADQLDLR